MSPNAPDPTPPKAGGLWARLFGVNAKKPEAKPDPAAAPAPAGAPADNGVDVEAVTLPEMELEPAAAAPPAPAAAPNGGAAVLREPELVAEDVETEPVAEPQSEPVAEALPVVENEPALEA